ncbi:uncharacterized protein [Watersipora subatra]|uniref:uncharacterized protein n=1 Tax=Watersipora subatra TaxID=2589382 RepID=UPI00355B1D1B
MKEVSGGKIWNEDDVKVIAEGMKMKEEVAAKLRENVDLLHKLQALQDELMPVARRGALIYTVLRSLTAISPHYQFKLPQFLQMFYESVGQDPPPDVFVEDEDDQQELDEDVVDGQPSKSGKTRATRDPNLGSVKTSEPTATNSNEDPGGYTDDFEGEDGHRGEMQTPSSKSAASDAKPGDHDITPFMQVLENLPSFPTEGVDYSSLQTNQAKQCVDAFTEHSMKYARMSLDGDHQLLFNAVMCLTVHKGSEELFSEEELSLLTQGNPGLGLSLSLDDFGCEAKPPEWLPKDRWENVMAISVLPGPLDNLCVRIAENPEAWHKWYLSDTPERQMVSQTIDGGDDNTVSSDNKEDKAEEEEATPKEKPTEKENPEMSDFHKLLVLRMMRPDRLHYALSDYVSKHMPADLSEPLLYDSMKSYISSHNLATMIVLPSPTTCVHSTARIDLDIASKLAKAAQSRNVEFTHITMGAGCLSRLDNLLDAATKSETDNWVLIDKLHLAPDAVLKVIKKRLQAVVRTKDTDETAPQLIIWMTAEPSDRLPTSLLESVLSISWHFITDDFFGAGERKVTSAPLACLTDALIRGIVISLSLVSEEMWAKVDKEKQSIKVLCFAIGLVHGFISTRQIVGTAGLSQWYPFSSVQMMEAVQVAISPMFSDLKEELMLENKINFLSENVFGPLMASEEDRTLVTSFSNMILRSVVFNTIGTLTFGGYDIPLPPPNVAPKGYSEWFREKQAEAALSTITAIGLHPGAQKQHDNYRSVRFVEQLDRLYEAQNSDSLELPKLHSLAADTDINISQLNMICLNCLERLPALIELGNLVPVSASSHYNFPYHPPSAYSDVSTAKGLMPESIGHVLLQECFYMNALLCHIRQMLFEITDALISGPDGLPMMHLQAAKALAFEQVPLSWNHPTLQPNTHTLFSWLEDLNKRHAQMRAWNKTGMVPKPKLQQGKLIIDDNYMFHGRLKSVWLGGLFNPLGLLTALRHEKAILNNVLLDEVDLVCEPLSLDQQNEGDLIVEGLHIQSADWDAETGALVDSQNYVNAMPNICVRAVTQQEMMRQSSLSEGTGETSDETKKDDPSEKDNYNYYSCPIFTTRNHTVLVAHLPLKTKEDPIKWQAALTCLLLDKGVPESYVRKHQLIHPAKAQDLQATQNDTDSVYLSRLHNALHESAGESKQRTARTAPKLPTPRSQLSYKAMTPKAAPLPPSLSMQRQGHGRGGPAQASGSSPEAESRRASRNSVFRSIIQDGNRVSTSASDGKADGGEKKGVGSKGVSTKSTPKGSKGNTPAGSKTASPKIGQSPKLGPSPKVGQSPKGGLSPASRRSTPK